MRWIPLLLLFGPSTWTFDKDEPDKAPAGFEFTTTRKSKAGDWRVQKDGDNLVLAQLDDKDVPDNRFAMAIAKEASFKDLVLSVKIKPVSGENDQTGGLVWRYQDADNYYVARLNVLETNVRLYRVVKGNRIKFAGKEEVKLKAGEWYTLKVEHRGMTIKVYLNDEKMVESEDRTFTDAGKIGVWIKADSVTYFDDLKAEEVK